MESFYQAPACNRRAWALAVRATDGILDARADLAGDAAAVSVALSLDLGEE